MPQGAAARGENPKKRKGGRDKAGSGENPKKQKEKRPPNPILKTDIFDLTKGSEHIKAAADFFEEKGFVVCKFKEDTDWVRKYVLELWIKFYANDGRKDDSTIKVKDIHGNVLNPNNPEHQQQFLDIVMGPLLKDLCDQYWKLAGLHKTFGASATAQSFNLEGQWELRQNPELYELAQEILKVQQLFMSLDRAKHVAAKYGGQKEFMHIENGKFLRDVLLSLKGDSKMEPEKRTSLSGIVNLSGCDLHFQCIPKSHTRFFQECMLLTDKNLRQKVEKMVNGGKLSLNDHDQKLGLAGQFVDIPVPPGVAIYFDSDLIHETARNNTPFIIYGFYIGYLTAMRPEYQKETGVTEMEDRQNVYKNGGSPKRYPSLDLVQDVPKLIQRSARRHMKSHVEMYPPGDKRVFKRKFRKTKTYPAGQELDWWRNVPLNELCPGYTPPPLSHLGEKLLGTRNWD